VQLRSMLSLPVAALALVACRGFSTVSQDPSPEPTHIRLPMGYIPNVQYAPFYIAVDRGYFLEEGIEVEFDYSFETDGVQLVGANQLPFALVSGEQVLLARAQGLPLVYVYAWWQDYPVAIAAPQEKGIRTPEDLVGKRVGIPGLFGASYIGYRAILGAAGLPDDVAILDSIGFNQVEALLAGQADAVVIYANNEPIQLEAQGMPVSLIRVADYVRLASNGLVTNEATLAANPDLVRGMLRAVARGLEEAIAHPEAAFEVCLKFVEGLEQADQTVQMKVLRASIDFWRAERLGFSQPEAWENMHQVLLQAGLLTQPLDVTEAYSNEYLP